MKLDDYRQSDNVEDRRDDSSSSGPSYSGGSNYSYSGGGRSVQWTWGRVALVLLLLVVGYFLQGRDGGSGSTAPAGRTGSSRAGNDAAKVFVSKVLATTEDAWKDRLSAEGKTYTAPKLTLFRDEVRSACGLEDAAVGPFYCPGDRHVYLDLDFFDELRSRFGAPGDFAQGYVVAHEVGHHVQNLLGSSRAAERQGLKRGAEGTSVRLELQADCYAGMWGAWAQEKGLLDPGDVEEALTAAKAIGDDTLQRQAGARVRPETFSHGSSAQRVKWFKAGFEAKSTADCDTFHAESL